MTGAWNIELDHAGRIFQVGNSYSDEQIAKGDTFVRHFNGDKPRAHRWGSRYVRGVFLHREHDEVVTEQVNVYAM